MRKLKIGLMAMMIGAVGFAAETNDRDLVEQNQKKIEQNQKMIAMLEHDLENFDGAILVYEAEIENLKEENRKINLTIQENDR